MLARRRKKVLGIPVGRARRTLPVGRLAGAGAVGATALAAVPAARRGMQMAGRGMEMAGKVHQVTDKVGDVVGAAGQVQEAVSSHSSTVGKAVGMVGAVKNIASKGKGGTGKPKLSHLIEENTEISVARAVAYNQWTQMEMLPSLVKGVVAVDQTEDDETQWTSKIGPVRRQWKAKITEQVPDERIVWESDGGPEHHGVVSFHSLDDELTRVLVQMHYIPHGPFEVVANKLRIQRRRVRRDLRLFKHFLELRGEETGAWRGGIGENSSGRSSSGRGGESGRSASGRSASGRSGSGGSSGRSESSGSSRSPARRSTSGTSSARSDDRSNGRSSTRNGNRPSGRSSGSANGRAPEARRTSTRRKEATK